MLQLTLQEIIKTHADFLALHQEEFRLLFHLQRLLARGMPVSPEQLATVSHRSPEEIQALFQSSNTEFDQEGNIVGFGLSLQPTPHQFHLGEKTLYGWCALDTLAFPALLGRTARVVSSCPATGADIRLTVTPERIEHLEPVSAVISARLAGADTDFCDVRGVICNYGHFFVSREVASAWPSLHPQAVLLPVEEAAELGRELARQVFAIEQTS